QCRFLNGFSKCWVRMRHSCNIFSTCAVFHGSYSSSDHVSRSGTNHMNSQNLICLFVRSDFNKTINIARSTASTQSTHWETTYLTSYTFLLKLLLSLTNCGNFRPGINYARNEVIVNVRFLSGNLLGYK